MVTGQFDTRVLDPESPYYVPSEPRRRRRRRRRPSPAAPCYLATSCQCSTIHPLRSSLLIHGLKGRGKGQPLPFT